MVCLNCPPSTSFFKDIYLYAVTNDEQVKPGDVYHIYVDVRTNALLLGDYGRVCLYDGSNKIAYSESFYLKQSEKYQTTFTGVMPDHDLYLNVSLVDEQIYGLSDCADGQAIQIKKGLTTISIDPIPPDTGEDGDAVDWMEWISENIVLILVLILFIILIIKFG